jgi:hypothetical protein
MVGWHYLFIPMLKNILYFQLEIECEMKHLGWKHGKMDNKNNQQYSCKVICQSHKCNIYI